MTTYYVATTGSDSNTGATGSPFLTIQKACNVAASGDTIKIRTGTYAPFYSSRNAIIGPDTAATVVVECSASYSTAYGVAGAEFGATLAGWTAGSVTGIRFRNARNQWGAGLRLSGCHGTGPGAAGGNSIVLTDIIANNNHSFGIYILNSDHVDVINPTVYKNDTGMEFSGSSECYVEKLIQHDNDQLVSPSRGGNGTVFYRSHDILVDGLDPSAYAGGLSYNNRCVSSLYPPADGGHFEQYASYNVRITNMRGWNSQNVIETGQDSTDLAASSAGWEFDHNIFYATDPGYPAPLVSGTNYGLVIRAMQGGSFHHNTFHGLGVETLLVMNGGSFAGDVTGFTFRSNIVYGAGSGSRCVSIASGVSGVVCDYNDLFNPGGTLGHRTGTDQTHGVNADPLFVNLAGRDYHLTTSSPCIGTGL